MKKEMLEQKRHIAELEAHRTSVEGPSILTKVLEGVNALQGLFFFQRCEILRESD